MIPVQAIRRPSIGLGSPVATSLAIASQPSSAVEDTNFTVTVQVKDQFGNNITSTASIAVVKQSGTGTLSGTSPVSAVAGLATFSNLQMDTSGATVVLRFSATGLGTVDTSNISITTSDTAEPSYNAATDTMIKQDTFDTYVGVTTGSPRLSQSWVLGSSSVISLQTGRVGGQCVRVTYTNAVYFGLLEHGFTTAPEVFWSYWFYKSSSPTMDPTFGGSNPSGFKWWELWRPTAARQTWGVGILNMNNTTAYPSIGRTNAGLEFSTHDNSSPTTSQPNPFTQNLGLTPQTSPRFGNLAFDTWHRITGRAVTGNGVADRSGGGEQIWINGTLVLDSFSLSGLTRSSEGFNLIKFPDQTVSAPTGIYDGGYLQIDDFTMWRPT